MNVPGSDGSGESVDEFLVLEKRAVGLGGEGGEGSRVPSHAFVDDEHAGIGGGFGHDVVEEYGALVGSGVGSKGHFDGVDVIVDCFGHADYSDLSVVLGEEVLG